MSMKRHTFDEVCRLDDALYHLAVYEVTGGKLVIPKSMEDIMKFQMQTAEKFNEFKRLIQSGESTLEHIKWTVLDKNGPFIQHDKDSQNFNDIDIHNALSEWETEAEENQGPQPNEINAFIQKMMTTAFNDDKPLPLNDQDDKPPLSNDQNTKIPPKITLEDLGSKKKKRYPKKQ